jgi:hypothetical protein
MSRKSPEGLAERQAMLARAPYEDMLAFFDYKHLPEGLQGISMPFNKLANSLVDQLPNHPQKMIALQKLLEAKDAAVRIAVAKTRIRRKEIQNLIIECQSKGNSPEEILTSIQNEYPASKITLEVLRDFLETLEEESI